MPLIGPENQDWALIGWIIVLLTPALLCHKDTAQGTQRPTGSGPFCSLTRVWEQCGPLDVEIISEEFIVMLRQLSYAIKNQLKAPKAPY